MKNNFASLREWDMHSPLKLFFTKYEIFDQVTLKEKKI